MYLKLSITRHLSFSYLTSKEDNEAEQLVSSQEVHVNISSKQVAVSRVIESLLLLILVSSWQCKSERLCGWERIWFFSLKSYLKASCFVGINIMYYKKLLKNLY